MNPMNNEHQMNVNGKEEQDREQMTTMMILWRKDKQMQPMQLCIHSGRRLEDTFENTQW